MSNPAPSATKLFVKTFGTKPDMLFSAPARVNLIGEHTDYNDGFVLPVAINFHTVIAVKVRKDQQFRAISDAYGDIRQWQFGEEGDSQADDEWVNYLKGFSGAIAKTGLSVKGLDLAVVGNVPAKAGLAASASLEIAFGTAVNDTSQLHLSPLAVAQLAQRSENNYLGYGCGIMDQLTSAIAEEESALLIDCMDLECQPVKIPDDLSLMLINSGLPSVLQSDEFNLRRQQCEQVAQHFGLDSLRDLRLAQLTAAKDELDPVAYRRAHHVVTENTRTQQAARALARGDIAKISQLMAESHASMRDDFETSHPSIDMLVDIIQQQVGAHGGVRLAGKGFGGCVVALVEHEVTDKVINAVEQQYQAQTGLEANIYLCSPCAGASRVDK